MDFLYIVCPHCLTVNRLPGTRFNAGPNCGKCAGALFTGAPVELKRSAFEKHRDRNDIPLLIDCWAPWCGPCQMMGPAFAQAAKELEPRLRLGKINTESEQQLAGQLNIRSIPTLILFHQGREIARQSGALTTPQIVHWAQSQCR